MNERKKETLLFLSKLLALSIPLYIVLWLGVDLGFLQETITRIVFSFFSMTGEVQRHGFVLVFPGFSVNIDKDCTGWKGMMFLLALILSTRASWKKRLAGIAVGLPVFFSFNLFRILFMIWIGLGSRETFYLLHDVLWQASMIAVVMVLWLMWARLDINNSGSRRKPWKEGNSSKGSGTRQT